MNNLIQALVTVVILFALIACGSKPPSPRLSEYDRYKLYMSPKEGAPNFKAARDTLERLAYSPSVSEKVRNSFAQLLAINLYEGKFGYFDEEGFVYWAKSLGRNKGIELHKRLTGIEKFYQSYKANRLYLNGIYMTAINYCDSDVKAKLNMLADDKNKALHYFNGVDCMFDHLIEKKELRRLYARHIDLVGTTKTKSLIAKGFDLYAKEDKAPYSALLIKEQAALLLAKIQAFNFAAKTTKPKYDVQVGYRTPDIVKAVQRLNSDNDSDWLLAASIVDDILVDDKQPQLERAWLLNRICESAFAKDRLNYYLKYRDQLLAMNILSVEEENFFENTTMLFLHDQRQYQQGNQLANKLIARLKNN